MLPDTAIDSGCGNGDIVSIAAGPAVSAAIMHTGCAFVWGDETNGQLGRGTRPFSTPSPTLLVQGGSSKRCDQSVASILPPGGSEQGYWRDDEAGLFKPIEPTFTKIVFGDTHALALTAHGRVIAWGNNTDGQCGVSKAERASSLLDSVRELTNRPTTDTDSPEAQENVPNLLADPSVDIAAVQKHSPLAVIHPTELGCVLRRKVIIDIAAGFAHSVCVATDGSVFTFGDGALGQLGGGAITQSFPFSIPSNITAAFPFPSTAASSAVNERVVNVAAGRSHCLARTQLGRLYSWGTGNEYALGYTNNGKPQLTPRLVEYFNNTYVLEMQALGDLSAIITCSPSSAEFNKKILPSPQQRIRSNDLRQQLPMPTIAVDSLAVWTGTYNINAKPGAISVAALSAWLVEKREAEHSLDASETIPDIYAFGFQEFVKLDIRNVGKDHLEVEGSNMKAVCEKNIEEAINRTVNARKASFVQIFSKQLVGVLLCVYVRRELMPLIQNVKGKETRVGLMGIAGNKGSVAVSFDVADTQFCFISSHLASGVRNIEKRNDDYCTIASAIEFATPVSRVSFADLDPGKAGNEPLGMQERALFDHDHIFWFGDFNYRISGIANDQIKSMIKRKQLEELALADQLNQAREADHCFIGFQEGRIAGFDPTYKYDLFTTSYDTSAKQRAPAWCDRVLWRGNARLVSYRRSELFSSDHRPVMGLFEVKVRKIRYCTPVLTIVVTNPVVLDDGRCLSIGQATEQWNAPQRSRAKLQSSELPTSAILTNDPTSVSALSSIAEASTNYFSIASNFEEENFIGLFKATEDGRSSTTVNSCKNIGCVSQEYLDCTITMMENSNLDSPVVARRLVNTNSRVHRTLEPLALGGRWSADFSQQEQEQQEILVQGLQAQQGRLSIAPHTMSRSRLSVGTDYTVNFDMIGSFKQGWLKKRGHFRTNWKLRYFILERNSLQYFEERISGMNDGQRALGSIDMRQDGLRVRIEATMEKKTGSVLHRFHLHSEDSNAGLLMEAHSRIEMISWIDALSSVIALNSATLMDERRSIQRK